MRIEDRAKAIELRKDGWSTTKIAKELGICKSSAFNWTKDVPLSDDQRERLFKNQGANWRGALDVWVTKCSDKRLKHQKIGRLEIDRNNWEHVAGCMLWWAEGDKSRNIVAI